MDMLSAALPQSVTLRGKAVPIRTDYRTALRVMAAFEDEALADAEKAELLLRLLYPQPVPPQDKQEAVAQGIAFLNAGLPPAAPQPVRMYSFTQDAPYICAAMQKSHGVDLFAQPPMHWHRFVSLFMDLDENCLFTRLVYLRSRAARGALTPAEKQLYAELRGAVTLQSEPSREEQAFMRRLRGGKENDEEH